MLKVFFFVPLLLVTNLSWALKKNVQNLFIFTFGKQTSKQTKLKKNTQKQITASKTTSVISEPENSFVFPQLS